MFIKEEKGVIIKRAFIAALPAVFLASFAAQAADGWYGAAHFGKGWKGDADMDLSITTSLPDNLPFSATLPPGGPTITDYSQGGVSYTSGWGGGLAVGRILGNWRLEGELFYRKSQVDDLHVDDWSFSLAPADDAVRQLLVSQGLTLENRLRQQASGVLEVSGNLGLFSTLLNAYYDMPTQWPLAPYIGGGIGAVHANKRKHLAVNCGTTLQPRRQSAGVGCQPGASQAAVEDSHKRSWDFAWQVMAGLRYPVADAMDLTLGWRYASLSSLEFSLLEDDRGFGESVLPLMEVELEGMHSVELGLIYRF